MEAIKSQSAIRNETHTVQVSSFYKIFNSRTVSNPGCEYVECRMKFSLKREPKYLENFNKMLRK